MENASKALLMAAGVLIGIMVLSLAVYLATSFSQLYADVNEKNVQQQLVQFNTRYTAYEYRTDLTIYDILTVVGYAKENNKKYKEDLTKENSISIYLKRDGSNIKDIQEKEQSDWDKFIKADQEELFNSVDKKLPTYTCSHIGYNSEGRVKEVKFEKN